MAQLQRAAQSMPSTRNHTPTQGTAHANHDTHGTHHNPSPGELVREPRFIAGATTTSFLEGFTFKPRVMEVVLPGERGARAGARGQGTPACCY